ncbi:putative beta-D-xylosidase 6 [Senna tora]|uniref:Putative beta-D-xylosidase 6 n=1 Tax=Senna tora TaxID=362788 RepID=A0A834SX57_9FABA|nr:putative beta-D-xylosidase 6 [Senna tora]
MSHPWTSLFFLLLQFLQFHSPSSEPITLSTTPFPDFPCKPLRHSSYPFCNTSLHTSTRAHSLVSLLTLPEKILLLSNDASSVPRLGIPAYEWWSESLHGIAPNGPGVSFSGTIPSATSFPQVIVTAASFNRSLWSLIGSAIAIEARAMYNVGQAGLTFWAPNINIFRDPRWGRGQETPGEDPMVTSAYAIEYVRALQGANWKGSGETRNGFGEKRVLSDNGAESDDGLMVSACCKHYTAYDLEKWSDLTRYTFNAVVSEQDLEDTYQPPFRSCIQQGKASCLMCSYNAVNGVPACASEDLLELARNSWDFQGYITSDCDAVATVYEYQKYTKSAEDAVADVLKAGVDINCGSFMLQHTQSAIEQGKVKEEELDRALVNLFTVQMRLGLFDGDPRRGQFGKLGPQDVCSPQHKALALEAARQGIVLLKNDKNFLPLNKNGVNTLAVIGPMATTSKLGGGYSGTPCSSKSLYEGLKEYAKRISYASGCFDVSCSSEDGFDKAIHTAEEADYVVIVAGLDTTQESEDLDRVSLLLPGKQASLVSSVAAASKCPVILVLTGGGPLDVSFAERNPQIASILWVGYPGEAGGKALAEIIFGEANPAGRLPMTWYPESFTKIPMSDMRMRADPTRGYPGRTYRFYTGSRVYGFGHGLSYSTFSYKFLSAPNKIVLSRTFKDGSIKGILSQIGKQVYEVNYIPIDKMQNCNSLKFSAQISVMNLGELDGSHVVMLFSRGPQGLKGSPETHLIGFIRVHTISYQSTETSILVDPCEHFSFVDENGKRILPLEKPDGSFTWDNSEIILDIRSHFINTFCNDSSSHSLIRDLSIPNIPVINSSNHSNLISIPSIDEIKSTCFSLHPLKAPGIDGFHALFYQRSWETISTSLSREIRSIFETGVIPQDWSDTLITLIPKIENASKPSHFRPIGLCTTQYKILSKLIANRIKPLLPAIISPVQGAFMKGKHTSDLFITAHEIMYSMNKSKSKDGWVIIKLDIHKAFDSISWPFIIKMLNLFNLPYPLINIISSCLSSANYSIIINGQVTEKFSPSCGIRQGDPISPYLFILVSNIWSNRNLLLFKNKPFCPRVIFNISIHNAAEYHFLINNHQPPPSKTIALIKWKEPSRSFFKLNTDGSASNSLLGAGGIIRDERGQHVASFCKFVGYGHSLSAELWALQLGITLAASLQIKRLEIESDASAVINLIKNYELTTFHPFFSIISHCRDLLSTFEAWNLSHIYREANCCADTIANFGRTQRCDLTVFHHPPSFLFSSIRMDLQRLGRERHIKGVT